MRQINRPLPQTVLTAQKKPATDPSLGRTDGRFLKLVCELPDSLATAHHPTVPPGGERTVIIIGAIAVALTDHCSSPRSNAQAQCKRPGHFSQAVLSFRPHCDLIAVD
jgi:hypothetical protein